MSGKTKCGFGLKVESAETGKGGMDGVRVETKCVAEFALPERDMNELAAAVYRLMLNRVVRAVGESCYDLAKVCGQACRWGGKGGAE